MLILNFFLIAYCFGIISCISLDEHRSIIFIAHRLQWFNLQCLAKVCKYVMNNSQLQLFNWIIHFYFRNQTY